MAVVSACRRNNAHMILYHVILDIRTLLQFIILIICFTEEEIELIFPSLPITPFVTTDIKAGIKSDIQSGIKVELSTADSFQMVSTPRRSTRRSAAWLTELDRANIGLLNRIYFRRFK